MRISEYSIHKITKKSLAVVSAAAASLFLLTGMSSVSAEDVHWTYYGEAGPEHWGELLDSQGEVAFPLCGAGTEQSPIDINGTKEADLSDIQFNYKSTPLEIKNNGHTIQVNYASGRGSIKANGETYNLLQFHFHKVSEHTVAGKHAALEGHMVHISDDGVLTVVAFLMKEGDDANPTFQRILNNMPHEEGTNTVAGKSVNAGSLLPSDDEYYKYNGSLTTPPCSEGVRWHVLKEPIEISAAQIAEFGALEFLHHDGQFIGNNRPVRPLNDRDVLEND